MLGITDLPPNYKHGIIITGLPKTANYNKVKSFMEKLRIKINLIKELIVAMDSQGDCKGIAFCYFDYFRAAKDTMNSIVGMKIDDSYVLNASIIMDKSLLKLRNHQSICIRELKQGVTEQTIIDELENVHGKTILSLKIIQTMKRRDAYITLEKTEEAIELCTLPIKDLERLTSIDLQFLPEQEDQEVPIIKKPSKDMKRAGIYNVQIVFNVPLIQHDSQVYENLIEEMLEKIFEISVQSVFVWGKKARHMIVRGSNSGSQSCPSLNKIFTPGGNVEPGKYDCYLNPKPQCDKLIFARKKGFICFYDEENCSKFLEQFGYVKSQFEFEIDEYFSFKIDKATEKQSQNESQRRTLPNQNKPANEREIQLALPNKEDDIQKIQDLLQNLFQEQQMQSRLF